MKTIFELTQPRDEVLQGELSEEMFVARLKNAMGGTADPVCRDASLFFSNTYLTAGLKTLLWEVLGGYWSSLQTRASPLPEPEVTDPFYEQVRSEKANKLKVLFAQLADEAKPLVKAWKGLATPMSLP